MFDFSRRKARSFNRREVGRFALMAALAGVVACANDPVALDIVVCENGMGPECVDGSLSLTVSGLPDALNASVLVHGPNGFSLTVTSSQTLRVLAGEYTVEARPVEGVGGSYDPETATQSVMVEGNAAVTIKYVEADQAG